MVQQSWEQFISLENMAFGLSKEDIEKDRSSIARLKDLLGIGWPQTAVKQGHPLVGLLNNRSPWRTGWLASFVSTLNSLAGCSGFHRLLERLKDPKEYRSAESEVETATLLIDAGLPIRLVSRGGKAPDMATSVDGHTVYVEVTDVRPPTDYERADRVQSRIMSFFFHLPSELSLACRVLRPLSDPHLGEVIEMLERALGEVRSMGLSIKEVREEGVVEAYIFRKEAKVNIPDHMNLVSVELPPLELEVWRLPKIIDDKTRQLPSGEPGAVFVKDQNLTAMLFRPGFYSELAAYISETVYDHSRLCMAVISESYLSSRSVTMSQAAKDYVLVRRGRYDNTYQDDILVVPNRYGPFAETGSRMANRIRALAVQKSEIS